MSKLLGFLFVSLFAFGGTGCPRPQAPPPLDMAVLRTLMASTPPPANAAQELQKRLDTERELRLKAEARLAEEAKAKSRWQTGALLAIPGAILLLLAGTMLGTRARHDAQK